MIATHDPRMISRAIALLAGRGSGTESYEFQMLYGIRVNEQRQLSRVGHQMRVYVPYGED